MFFSYAVLLSLVCPTARGPATLAQRGGAPRLREGEGGDLSSAFAARMREVAGSDTPSQIAASERTAALRAKAAAAREAAESVKADAADFLSGGKKAVSSRAYRDDDLAEIPWYASSDVSFIGGVVGLLAALLVGNAVVAQLDDADRQLVAAAQNSNPELSRCIDAAFSRREVRECKSDFVPP